MSTFWIRCSFFLLVLLMLSGCQSRIPVGDSSSASRLTLQIKDQTLSIEIADSDAERMQGLSGREPLPDNHAMLFVFPQPVRGSFWMKDMKFALDVIWVKDNRVVDIDENVPPPALTNNVPEIIYPNSEYTHVIEIKGGWAEQHKIAIGDVVTLPR